MIAAIAENTQIPGPPRGVQLQIYAMNTRDGPTALKSSWQNACVERVIGSIRLECLDHMITSNAAHLHRVLRAYANYHNQARPL